MNSRPQNYAMIDFFSFHKTDLIRIKHIARLLRETKLLFGLPSKEEKLLPCSKDLNANLFELFVSEHGEGWQVNLVSEEHVSILPKALV